MGLLRDKSHKKIDLKSLGRDKFKKLSIMVSSLVMSLTIFSGSKKINENIPKEVPNTTSISSTIDAPFDSDSDYIEVDDETYEIVNDTVETNYNSYNDTFELKNAFSITLDNGHTSSSIRKYSIDDLKRVVSISVVLEDGVDYSYLNYMPNLKHIDFTDNFKAGKLDYIDGSIFKNGIDIIFNPVSSDFISSFTEEKFPFLKQIFSINTLCVGRDNAYNTNGNFIKDLNVDNLILNIDENTNIKTIDFSNVKSLEIKGLPYNVAIYITPKDIVELEKKGISVKYDSIDKFIEVSNEIDSIYNSLGITDSLTDKEKLDKIITYELSKYSYDEKIQELCDKGIEHSSETMKFYDGGLLYGSLNKDTEICGNYASITSALCKRAGIDSYLLTSVNHAWNAIEIGDYYYYVDPTWIDQQSIVIPYDKDTITFDNGETVQTHDYVYKSAEEIFKDGSDYEKSNLTWYLENPFDLPNTGNKGASHDLRFIPDGLVLTDIPDKFRIEQLGIEAEKVTDNKTNYTYYNNNDTYKVTVKKSDNTREIHFVPSSVIIGILTGLGVGVLRLKKNSKNNKKDDDDENKKSL